ncbi:hypothetical protein ACMFMG_010242 [Clarireedia jacksonii]
MAEPLQSPNPISHPTPPPPRMRKTRFVCISDTHNATAPSSFQLPLGDVLIHAGDLTNQGSYSELRKTIKWIEDADFEAKIIVAGTSFHVAGSLSFFTVTYYAMLRYKKKKKTCTSTPQPQHHTIANSCAPYKVTTT